MNHSFKSALKRDLKRLLGRERYQVGWVKTGPKSRVGRFAETQSESSCEQCGEFGRYFHLVNDSIPYPWIWSHDRLVCHGCHLGNRGTTAVSQYDPREVFEEEVRQTGAKTRVAKGVTAGP